jgi:hypothetical protein
MRDYTSLGSSRVARVLIHPSTLGADILKRREVAFAITAAFFVAISSGALVVRGLAMGAPQHNDSVTADQQSTTATTITAAKDDTQPVAEGSQPAMNTNDSSDSSGTSQSKTAVTVNDQKIDVPQNGTVTKTVQNGNGTTTVNVTNTSSSDGDSNSTTSSTLNVNTHTSTRSSKSSSSSP